jgi:hypothetical protein
MENFIHGRLIFIMENQNPELALIKEEEKKIKTELEEAAKGKIKK